MSGDFLPRPNDEGGGGAVGQTIQLEQTPARPLVERVPSLLRPLRNRNYALLFTGQLASLVGDQLYVVALPFLVLGHASVRELGLVLMCFGIARIATVPIGGVLADRMDKTKLMLLTDAGRALCVLAVAGLAFGPELSMLTVMALTAVLGALEGLFLPASYAILPDILSDDELPAGNALNTALESAAAFVGPALAGLVVAVFSPGVALTIDAVTFVVSAATLLALRVTPRARATAGESDQDTTADGSSRKGFVRFLAVSRIVQLTLLIVLFSNLAFDAMAEVALPVFSRDYLGTGAQGFGVMLSAFGAGAVVGGLLTDALFRVPRRGLIALRSRCGPGHRPRAGTARWWRPRRRVRPAGCLRPDGRGPERLLHDAPAAARTAADARTHDGRPHDGHLRRPAGVRRRGRTGAGSDRPRRHLRDMAGQCARARERDRASAHYFAKTWPARA